MGCWIGPEKGLQLHAGIGFAGVFCLVFASSGSWKVPGLEKVVMSVQILVICVVLNTDLVVLMHWG